MAVVRKFGGKNYKYHGSDIRKSTLSDLAKKLRKQGKFARISKTGKGLHTLYILYVR